MRILYVVPYTPSLIRVRPYHLLQALARAGHEVTLGTTWTTAKDRESLASIREKGISIVAAPMPVWRSLWNCTLALPSRWPLQCVYSWQPTLARHLKKITDQEAFDIVQFEHLRGARYGLQLRRHLAGEGALKTALVWDSVDCISHLFAQAVRHSLSTSGRWMTRLELRRTRRFERLLLRVFDQVVVTSPEDRRAFLELESSARFREHRPRDWGNRIAVIPNGVDLAHFTPPSRSRRSATLVFTGKMSYHANVTAVLHLVESIMPAVWTRRPDVELIVAGKDPSPEVRALATRQGDPFREGASGSAQRSVWVTGEVDDLRPYLARATLAVAPLVYGAGIQNKVLEAMATATAVVASPRAVGALQAHPGRDLLVAENADFASSILSLLENPDKRETLGCNARRYVEAHHSWDAAASRLVGIYQHLMQRRDHVQKSA